MILGAGRVIPDGGYLTFDQILSLFLNIVFLYDIFHGYLGEFLRKYGSSVLFRSRKKFYWEIIFEFCIKKLNFSFAHLKIPYIILAKALKVFLYQYGKKKIMNSKQKEVFLFTAGERLQIIYIKHFRIFGGGGKEQGWGCGGRGWCTYDSVPFGCPPVFGKMEKGNRICCIQEFSDSIDVIVARCHALINNKKRKKIGTGGGEKGEKWKRGGWECGINKGSFWYFCTFSKKESRKNLQVRFFATTLRPSSSCTPPCLQLLIRFWVFLLFHF